MKIGIFNARGLDDSNGEFFIPLEIEELKRLGHEIRFFYIKGNHPTKEDVEWMDFAIYHFVPTALFFRRMGVPYCVLPTANDIFVDNGERLLILDKDKKCKFIGYQSFYHKRKYEEWGLTKPLVHCPHSARTELFKRQTPYNPSGKIIAGGRLIPKKGLDRLKGMENLTIFGDGVLKEELKKNLHCSSIFTGYLDGNQLKDLFEESSIYLFPAIVTPDGDSDGLSNTIKEAMLMELPVICSSVAGNVEFENVVHLNDWSKINEVIKSIPKEPNWKGRQEILKLFDPKIAVKMLEQGIIKYANG